MHNSSIEPELNSLISKLTIAIENDQKELDNCKKRIEKNEHLLRAAKGSLGALHPEKGDSEYGSKRETILDAIKQFPKQQFTQDDIEGEVQRINPEMEINRSRIRSALWTLASNNKIKTVRKGNAQEPALYEKIEAPANKILPAPKWRKIEPNLPSK